MNWFNDNLFVILLVGGSVLSWIVRASSDNPITGALVATIICLFCLIWYFYKALGDRVRSYHSDNVYYLGLLFTLVSLVYSLVTLFILNSEKFEGAEQTHNLIGSFGIALVSTIFGILFRVLLLQQEEPRGEILEGTSKQRRSRLWLNKPDKEPRSAQENLTETAFKTAQESLAETAFKLRMELTQTIADVSVFRQAVIQAANETTLESKKTRAEMTKRMEEATNEQTRVLSTLSTKMVDEIDTSVKHAQESLNNLVNSQQTASSSVMESLQNIVSSLQITVQNAETLAAQSDSLYSSLQQIVTLFDSATPKIEQATKVLPDTAITVSDSFAQATEIMPQYTQQLEQLTIVLREVTEHWKSISPVTKDLQSIVSDLQTTARNTESLATRFDPLHAGLQQTLALLDNAVNGIKQATVTLPDTTRTFSDSLTEATEVMPQYTQQFEQLVTVLRKEAEHWQSMTQEVRLSLTQAIEDLTRIVRNS